MTRDSRARAANVILGLSAAVSVAAFPFSGSFGGGLLFHTAMAAAVGGMADWYAVNSLFRRPLGIGRGEGLIPESRDKIIRMARDMMTEEILTIPRLYRVLKAHSLSLALLQWMKEHRSAMESLAREVCAAVLREVPPKAAGRAAAAAARAAMREMNWADWLLRIAQGLTGPDQAQAILHVVKAGGIAFLREGVTDEEVLSIYRKTWALYEEKGMMRSMLRSLLQSQMGLTDEKAAAMIRQKIGAAIETIDDPESELYDRLTMAVRRWLRRLTEDEAFRGRVNDWMGRHIDRLIEERGSQWAAAIFQERRAAWGEKAGPQVVRFVLETLENEDTRRGLDRWILLRAAHFLPQLKAYIGNSVESALSLYSGRDMADQLEESVYGDLQMIRINGSVIGAVLGALSYLAFFFASGGKLL